ncbi:MAG: (2Fe-2S)-binding protein [Solirubrobacterales bacterium]|nr:(2Fe-2S)-binding protein [Solirubrobacterales bacterium]
MAGAGAIEGFDRTLGRIGAASADGYGIILRRLDGPGDGWFPASELDEKGRLQALLLSRIRGMAGPPEDYIRAEWLMESLARAVADLGGSFIVAAGQLPELSTENVLLAAEGGLFRATAVRSDRGIDCGERPGPEGLQELADRFRAGFTGLLEPTVAWVDGQHLRPAKTLWRSAADRLAQSLVWSGKAFDRPDLALDLTLLTVGPASPDPRLAIPVNRAEDDWGEEYHLRNTCCLAYRTEGGQLCQSCPLSRDQG